MRPPRCSVLPYHRVFAGVRLSPADGKPEVLVSRAAMNELGDMELRWVVAHELAHAADEPGIRRVRQLMFAHAIALVATFSFLAVRLVPIAALLSFALALAIGAATRALRRRLEREADLTAHRCCAADSDAGRRALMTVREASGPRSDRVMRVMQALRGYPPFEERIQPIAVDGPPGRPPAPAHT